MSASATSEAEDAAGEIDRAAIAYPAAVTSPDKRAIIDALIAHLQEDIATMTKAARSAIEAATHEEAKPENDKDTRALEASYLAAGQAERIRELESAVKLIRGLPLRELEPDAPIQASSVVTLEDDEGATTIFFVAPHGGGTSLSIADVTVQVVTPRSPLGQALLGRSQGEVVELRGKAGAKREMTIVAAR